MSEARIDLIVVEQQNKVKLWPEIEEELNHLAQKIMEEENIRDGKDLAIIFVDDEAIRYYNHKFRGVDATTDVLSFAVWQKSEEEPPWEDPEENTLGDVIISAPRALAQAKEYGVSFKEEIYRLAIHGIYHLLGYDHQQEEERKIMEEKEQKILFSFQQEKGGF